LADAQMHSSKSSEHFTPRPLTNDKAVRDDLHSRPESVDFS
jgi:hypothetical protein